MAGYQVEVVRRPDGWTPDCFDDVPSELGGPIEVLGESEDLFASVRQAVEHNRKSLADNGDRWAVVVERGSVGRVWPTGRLCTPIRYSVAPLWWPDTWEPISPLDVPSCIWKSENVSTEQRMTYDRAVATTRSLNRQCMDRPGTIWYVVIAVENESVSRTVSYEQGGTETTVEVRPLHVVRPEPGGRGDCSHCPAHSFPCAESDCAESEWESRTQTVTATQSGPFGDTSSADGQN